MKSAIIMNDYKFMPKPLKLITPDPDYKVNEKELAESIKKNKELISNIRKIRTSKGL